MSYWIREYEDLTIFGTDFRILGHENHKISLKWQNIALNDPKIWEKVTLVAAKVPKLKNLESPEADFFALDLGAEGERHEGKDFYSRSLIGH